MTLLNADELLLSNSSSTLIASERDEANGDRVLTFNYNPNHHRGRLQSANAMLNSSTCEPKVNRLLTVIYSNLITVSRFEI